MADSKVGQWLDSNQGEQINPGVSRDVLRAVIEDVLESTQIGDVAGKWLSDYFAVQQGQPQPMQPATPEHHTGQPQIPPGSPVPPRARRQ